MSTTPVSANRIRILTVDDHPLILEGIANVLHRQPDMELVAKLRMVSRLSRRLRSSGPMLP